MTFVYKSKNQWELQFNTFPDQRQKRPSLHCKGLSLTKRPLLMNRPGYVVTPQKPQQKQPKRVVTWARRLDAKVYEVEHSLRPTSEAKDEKHPHGLIREAYQIVFGKEKTPPLEQQPRKFNGYKLPTSLKKKRRQ